MLSNTDDAKKTLRNPANGFPAFVQIPAKNISIQQIRRTNSIFINGENVIGIGTHGGVLKCAFTSNKPQKAAIKISTRHNNNKHASTLAREPNYGDTHAIDDPINSHEENIDPLRKEYQLIHSMQHWKNYPSITGISSDYFVKSFGYVKHITLNEEAKTADSIAEKVKSVFFATEKTDTSTKHKKEDISHLITEYAQKNISHLIAEYAQEVLYIEDEAYTQKFVPGIIMELMEKSLSKALEENSLSIPQKIQIALQIASALYILHAQNIMHGDIKPRNILLDENNNAKLADFGSCTRVDYACKIYAATCRYLSIQNWWDIPPPALSNDIHALGITLLELFSNPQEIKGWVTHNQGDKRHIDTLLSFLKNDLSVPHRLITLIEYCIHTDPDQRPAIQQVITHIKLAIMLEQFKDTLSLKGLPHFQLSTEIVPSYYVNGFCKFEQIPTNNIHITNQIRIDENSSLFNCTYTDRNNKQQKAQITVYDDKAKDIAPLVTKEVDTHHKMRNWLSSPEIGHCSNYFVTSFGYVNSIFWNRNTSDDKHIINAINDLLPRQEITQLINAYASESIKIHEEIMIPGIITETTKQSLKDALEENRLSIFQKTKIAYQIVCALYVMHKNGFSHNNINPSSILLDENDNAKLHNLGAHIDSDDNDPVKGTKFAFTTAYHPNGKGVVINCNFEKKTLDIYSLGITLIEIFYKKPKRSEKNLFPYIRLERIRKSIVAALREDDSIPITLTSLIEDCTRSEHYKSSFPTEYARQSTIRNLNQNKTDNLDIFHQAIKNIKSLLAKEEFKIKHSQSPASLWSKSTHINPSPISTTLIPYMGTKEAQKDTPSFDDALLLHLKLYKEEQSATYAAYEILETTRPEQWINGVSISFKNTTTAFFNVFAKTLGARDIFGFNLDTTTHPYRQKLSAKLSGESKTNLSYHGKSFPKTAIESIRVSSNGEFTIKTTPTPQTPLDTDISANGTATTAVAPITAKISPTNK